MTGDVFSRSTDYGDNFVDDSAKVSNAVLDYYYINGLDNKMVDN